MLGITREAGEAVVIMEPGKPAATIRLMRLKGDLSAEFLLERGSKSNLFTMDLNESVLVGPNVDMQLQLMQRGQVRLGFSAHKSINIQREELLKQ